ncbi:MAG: HRDC domain-containing protein [Armatimonadetes bacterium]|nr:HRDC domain-containing protein [Anaerolineae bacterium]
MMSPTPLSPAHLIATDAALAALVAALSNEPLIAVDTESNSLYAYHERVCLVQLSSQTADYIIDPLAVKAMQPLGLLLANPNIEKVFHAAEYDLMCLRRDYGFQVVHMFDTMLAARMLGYKQIGLNHLLAQHVGVQVDKSHQRDNWGARPLPPDSLHYAQIDTHYLPTLRGILRQELSERGQLTEAQETFTELCASTPAHDGRSFDPDGYWKIGKPSHLTLPQMGVLRELYVLRETLAEAQDVPPFKIFSNQTLVALAKQMPVTANEMVGINGMTPAQIRRHSKTISAAVARGRAAQLPSPPQHRPPPPEISDRYISLHSWRKDKATQRGVESDVIVSKQTLWELAAQAPTTLTALSRIHGLGPWRLETYGLELLAVLAQYASDAAQALVDADAAQFTLTSDLEGNLEGTNGDE